MFIRSLDAIDRLCVLRFAAAFLWVDLTLGGPERAFLVALADELGVPSPDVDALLAAPPLPDDVDPARVDATVAPAVRDAALRAIAADGHVDGAEMSLFHILDELLPAA